MKKIALIVAAAVCVTAFSSSRPSNTRQVRFKTSMSCKNCEKKVVENISFEKGVKDLETSLESREVKVVYNPSKTDTLTLASAIRKLGFSAKVIEDKAL